LITAERKEREGDDRKRRGGKGCVYRKSTEKS
jgi:hypothetical protein